jgi:hypothetical protein
MLVGLTPSTNAAKRILTSLDRSFGLSFLICLSAQALRLEARPAAFHRQFSRQETKPSSPSPISPSAPLQSSSAQSAESVHFLRMGTTFDCRLPLLSRNIVQHTF